MKSAAYSFGTALVYIVSSTPSKPGDRVTFRCLIDTVVAVSACPFDLGIIHGEAVTPVKLVVSDSVHLP